PIEAEIVTISHEHSDHNQASRVKNVKKIINGPGEYEILGVSILGFSAYHDDKKGSLRGKNTIYVFEMDGVRCAHLGDLGHKLGEELTDNLGDIDVLLIPVGGEFTIGPEGATAVVQEVEPAIVIPMHYQAPGLNPQTFAKLLPVEAFLKEVGLSAETLPKLSLKKEEISQEGTKVVVLEKK
ncbi:MAG: MBL fold metallo-hydrolase, partial [Patescibacteria group bacterium]